MIMKQDGFLVLRRPVHNDMQLKIFFFRKKEERPQKIQTPFTSQQQNQQTTPSLPSKSRPNPDSH